MCWPPHDQARPTLREPILEVWFNGRYREEWAIGTRNKPSTAEAKLYVYK
jgi:hypothetical protein